MICCNESAGPDEADLRVNYFNQAGSSMEKRSLRNIEKPKPCSALLQGSQSTESFQIGK